jgi:hypothetical protein
MNRLAKWTMRLYPARWRRRYGDEMDALLADTGADARVVADLVKGGVRMQFKTWSLLKLALVLGFAGLLVGLGIAFLIPSEFVSKATLELTPGQNSGNELDVPVHNQLNELTLEIQTEVLSRASLAAVINEPDLLLYPEDQKARPLEDVIEEMRNNIRITIIALPGALGKRATALDIMFKYPDRFKAQQTVQVLIDRFEESSAQIQRTLPQAAGRHYLEVIDVASLPTKPDERVVALMGAVLAVLIVVAYRRLRQKSLLAWGFAIPAVAFGLLGAISVDLASALDHLPGYLYRSSATMLVQNGTPDQIRAIREEALSRASLSSVIQNPHLQLYKGQLKNTPLEDIIETMKKHLTITPIGDGQAFTISFKYGNRFRAQQTVQLVMDQLAAANHRLYGGLPDAPVSLTSANITILDAPSLPTTPASPNRASIAITGGILGMIVGAIIATIRRRWKPEGDIPIDAVTG